MHQRLLVVPLLVGLLPADLLAQSAAGGEKLNFFETKIRPVLAEHCYSCHSAESKTLRAGLRLDTREGIRAGGDSGPAVVPGDVDASLLMEAIRHESWEMPPTGKLPDSVLADFERWIKEGAVDPRDGTSPAESKPAVDPSELWSLQPLKKPTVPSVRDGAWAASPVDRFILAKLEDADLSAAEPAEPASLLRRIYFDLTGLPPTVEDLESFTADPSEEAYFRIVDRLLESPHFGERWGRHWLDVVRFAESSGGGRSVLLPDAWRYRDYVIRTFNQDKPFDHFITEQIAGDLLEPAPTMEARSDQIVAVGFLLLGPNNYELQDKELLRMEVVDEQLDCIGRAFLGLTIGCARCHDHKFDPIPTKDYYALAGIFRSTKSLVPGNVSGFETRELPVEPELAQAIAEYRRRKAVIDDELAPLKKQLAALQKGQQRSSAQLSGIVVDDEAAVYVGAWKHSRSVANFIDQGYRFDDRSVPGPKSARFEAALPVAGEYEVRLAYTPSSNRASNAPVKIHHADGVTELRIDQKSPPALNGLFTSLGRYKFPTNSKAVVELTTDAVDGLVIVDAVQFLPVGKDDQPSSTPSEAHAAKQAVAELTERIGRLEKELAALNKSAPPTPIAMCVREEQEIGDFHICIRGNVHKLGERVPRGFLTAAGVPAPTISGDQSGRRELVQWLTDPSHPLTTRVYCNRVWHWLMGAGLVRTTDNFGHMGEPPSHPQLLDWLAVTFQEQGWSTKKLIRTVVRSKTYRLSTRASAGSRRQDPENRWLSHQNRRRLEAEEIRDALLHIAGNLDWQTGGPSFASSAQEFGYEFTSRRRTVYEPVFRNQPHELLAVFDMADPNLVSGRRNVSTLATQALFLLNSPFLFEQAESAAKRLIAAPLQADERIDFAYRQSLGRRPTDEERRSTQEFLAQFSDDIRAWTLVYQSLFGCVDFRYLD